MSLSVADIESYAVSLGMPPELLPELARVMLTQLPGQLAAVEAAVAARNAEATFRSAHSYKGSVATLTDGEVTQSARQLEMLGRQLAPWPDIERQLAVLRAAHRQFMPLLDVLAARETAPPSAG